MKVNLFQENLRFYKRLNFHTGMYCENNKLEFSLENLIITVVVNKYVNMKRKYYIHKNNH